MIDQVQQGVKQKIKKEKIWTRDFVFICMANFLIFLGFQMTLPTISLYVKHLGGSDQLIGAVVGIFTFSALLIRPFAGKALETKGRRIVYFGGLIVFILTLASFGFMASIALLFMMRIIQGLGWGALTTATGTVASDLVPASRRGEGMGYFGLSGNIAMAIGPSLGLALVVMMPFNQFFLICAVLGIIAFLVATQIKFKKAEKMTVQPTGKKILDLYEKSSLKPSILAFFITFTFGGIATFLPLYTAQKGIDGIQWYFVIYALSVMLTRTFAGQLYDRKGHKAVFIPGTLLVFIAMLLLSWLPSTSMMLFAAFLYGFGFGSVQPALQAWAIDQAPQNRKGMANATFYSFFDLGIGIGAMIFGQIGHSFGYSSIYMTAAVSVFMSMVIYVLITREKAVR